MFQKTKFTYDPTNVTSGYFTFSFGSAKEPVNGRIELVNSSHTCREGLIHQMRRRIVNETSTQPTDKMRMIFRWSGGSSDNKEYGSNNNKKETNLIKGWIERSIPVLHAFDQLAGWPLTRAYKLEVPSDKNAWLKCCYYHSSRRWMKSSYLVSLYVLLVRMCKDERITGFKNFDGLMDTLKKIQKNKQSLKADSSYVFKSMPYWEAIMKGYPRLFRKKKIDYYWDDNRISSSGSSTEGIDYLVSGATNYTEVRKELLKVKKEIDAKKSK